MRFRLVVPTLLAALLVAPAAASAGTRGLTVKVPKGVTADKNFTLTVEGDTGPGDQAGGGFIVEVTILKGKAECPAEGERKRTGASGLSDNIWAPGPFRNATQTWVSKAGTYRLCGYLTQNTDQITFDSVFSKTFKVKALPRHAKLQLDSQKPKSGTYTASAAKILGGVPTSSLTFVLKAGKVISASATGIPNTSCFADFATQTPIADSFTTTTPTGDADSVIGTSLGATFAGAAPSGQIRITGGAASSKEFRGQLAVDSADDSCRGGFAFTAKRS